MTKPTVMKRALASAHLPGNLKLFLFGFYRKVSKRMTGIKSDDIHTTHTQNNNYQDADRAQAHRMDGQSGK